MGLQDQQLPGHMHKGSSVYMCMYRDEQVRDRSVKLCVCTCMCAVSVSASVSVCVSVCVQRCVCACVWRGVKTYRIITFSGGVGPHGCHGDLCCMHFCSGWRE